MKTSAILVTGLLFVAVFFSKTEAATECSVPASTRIFSPVCGSDGKTYSNTNHLTTTKTKCNLPDLRIADPSNCPGFPESHVENAARKAAAECKAEASSKIFSPVCGSDGKIYSNMDQARETKTKCKKADLQLADPANCPGFPEDFVETAARKALRFKDQL